MVLPRVFVRVVIREFSFARIPRREKKTQFFPIPRARAKSRELRGLLRALRFQMLVNESRSFECLPACPDRRVAQDWILAVAH